MTSDQIAWLSLGFLVGVAAAYSFAMAHAYWVKAGALLMMKDCTKKLRQSAEDKAILCESREQQLAMTKEYNVLQEKYIASLDDYKKLGEDSLKESQAYGECLQKYGELQDKYLELQKEHQALLKRCGGGAEGT
jgi:hypothetical protein